MKEMLLLALRNTVHAFRSELDIAVFLARGGKCLLAMLAVMLAAGASWLLHQPEAWWAAICAFALTGTAPRPAWARGIQQIAGTFCGTVFGILLAPLALRGPLSFIALSTLFATACLYIAAKRTASFFWILCAALFVYMVSILLASHGTDARPLAVAMWINAAIGTGAYLLVITVAAAIFPGQDPEDATPGAAAAPSGGPVDAVSDATLALVCAMSLAILSWIVYSFPSAGLAQAMTTTIVVLAVPHKKESAPSLYDVSIRIFHRLLGCLLGAVAVVLILPLAAGNYLYCLIALSVLVTVACHLRLGHPDVSYLGAQFGAVSILALVHDRHGLTDDVTTAGHRLLGIVIGNIATAIAFVVVHRLLSKRT